MFKMPKWRHAKTSNEKSVILLALGQFVKIWNKACCCWHRAVFWDGRLWGNCDICFFSFTQINRNSLRSLPKCIPHSNIFNNVINSNRIVFKHLQWSVLYINVWNNLTTWNPIFSRKQTLGDIEEITNLNELFKPNRKAWSNIFQKCNIWLNIIEILSYFKKASEQV